MCRPGCGEQPVVQVEELARTVAHDRAAAAVVVGEPPRIDLEETDAPDLMDYAPGVDAALADVLQKALQPMAWARCPRCAAGRPGDEARGEDASGAERSKQAAALLRSLLTRCIWPRIRSDQIRSGRPMLSDLI